MGEATTRLQGRLNWFREDQYSQLELLKQNQERFQEEIKTPLATQKEAVEQQQI